MRFISWGCFSPHAAQVETLSVGEVGFLTATIKNLADAMIGDTITDAVNPTPGTASRI